MVNEENSSLVSPQEPTEPISQDTTVSESSDATATRYLSQLEKEGKIKQSGKTGKGVSYSRI
jgi:predicted HTH transcriptional regulator